MKNYYVYILASQKGKVLYVGVTNNLERRVYEHKKGFVECFTQKYHVNKLVYFEQTTDVNVAIEREKQIKSWSRARKVKLVDTINPEWKEIEL